MKIIVRVRERRSSSRRLSTSACTEASNAEVISSAGQHFGSHGESARHRQALALAAGELVRIPAGRGAVQRDGLQPPFDRRRVLPGNGPHGLRSSVLERDPVSRRALTASGAVEVRTFGLDRGEAVRLGQAGVSDLSHTIIQHSLCHQK
jgi:hypothetical protein